MFPAVLGEPFASKDTKLLIDGKVVKRLVTEGREALPNEYSALLAGHGSHISHHWPAPRIGNEPHRFAWSGPALMEGLRFFHQAGLAWLGVIHTHPSTPPLPSPIDCDGWHYPSLSYWILSFAGREPELAVYQMVDGRFVTHPYTLA